MNRDWAEIISRRLDRLWKLVPRELDSILHNCDRSENGFIPDCEIKRVFKFFIFKELYRWWGLPSH